MTPEVRERARLICEQLGKDVAALVPEGIGRWERVWNIVAAADADFMAAVSGWEADPESAEAKRRVKLTYAAVLDAWHQAADEYRAGQGVEHA